MAVHLGPKNCFIHESYCLSDGDACSDLSGYVIPPLWRLFGLSWPPYDLGIDSQIHVPEVYKPPIQLSLQEHVLPSQF